MMTFLLLTILPRGLPSSQGLISAAQSLSDPLCVSYPIFTYSKESEIPQMSPAHTDQSLLSPLGHSCCLPSCLACLVFSFPLLSPKYAPLCTFIHCHGLCQSYSVILSAASAISFPQQGWELSFLYCFWWNGKKIKAEALRVRKSVSCEAQLF